MPMQQEVCSMYMYTTTAPQKQYKIQATVRGRSLWFARQVPYGLRWQKRAARARISNTKCGPHLENYIAEINISKFRGGLVSRLNVVE